MLQFRTFSLPPKQPYLLLALGFIHVWETRYRSFKQLLKKRQDKDLNYEFHMHISCVYVYLHFWKRYGLFLYFIFRSVVRQEIIFISVPTTGMNMCKSQPAEAWTWTVFRLEWFPSDVEFINVKGNLPRLAMCDGCSEVWLCGPSPIFCHHHICWPLPPLWYEQALNCWSNYWSLGLDYHLPTTLKLSFFSL